MIKEQSIYHDINKLWKIWHSVDKTEFYRFKLSNLKCSQARNYHICSSSGSSAFQKRLYKWGPDFANHHNFYNNLFFDNQHYVYLIFKPNCNHNKIYLQELDHAKSCFQMNLVVKDGFDNNLEHKFYNYHISTNPEMFFYALKTYGDFTEYYFDKKSCTFAFTGSELTDEMKIFFESLGIKCKDYMRSWDGGATFYTCPFFNKHWLDISSIIKFEEKKLFSTDLWNEAQQHINYWNHDLLESYIVGLCECGMPSIKLNWITNPRHFTVKNKVFYYDEVKAYINRKINCELISFEYSDELVLVKITSKNDIINTELIKTLPLLFGTKVDFEINNMPNYERKFIRIKRINT
jgi:hypothetical protein